MLKNGNDGGYYRQLAGRRLSYCKSRSDKVRLPLRSGAAMHPTAVTKQSAANAAPWRTRCGFKRGCRLRVVPSQRPSCLCKRTGLPKASLPKTLISIYKQPLPFFFKNKIFIILEKIFLIKAVDSSSKSKHLQLYLVPCNRVVFGINSLISRP